MYPNTEKETESSCNFGKSGYEDPEPYQSYGERPEESNCNFGKSGYED